MSEGDGDRESRLPDVTNANIGALLSGGDPDLTEAVRRLVEDVRAEGAPISGWSSYLDDQKQADGAPDP